MTADVSLPSVDKIQTHISKRQQKRQFVPYAPTEVRTPDRQVPAKAQDLNLENEYKDAVLSSNNLYEARTIAFYSKKKTRSQNISVTRGTKSDSGSNKNDLTEYTRSGLHA